MENLLKKIALVSAFCLLLVSCNDSQQVMNSVDNTIVKAQLDTSGQNNSISYVDYNPNNNELKDIMKSKGINAPFYTTAKADFVYTLDQWRTTKSVYVENLGGSSSKITLKAVYPYSNIEYSVHAWVCTNFECSKTVDIWLNNSNKNYMTKTYDR